MRRGAGRTADYAGHQHQPGRVVRRDRAGPLGASRRAAVPTGRRRCRWAVGRPGCRPAGPARVHRRGRAGSSRTRRRRDPCRTGRRTLAVADAVETDHLAVRLPIRPAHRRCSLPQRHRLRRSLRDPGGRHPAGTGHLHRRCRQLRYRVVVNHGEGIQSTYSHLQQIMVQVGDEVTQSNAVGLVGTTGRSTGCHLHFEIIVNGGFTDPLPYLTGNPAANPTTFGEGSTPGEPTDEASESPSPTPSPSQAPDPCRIAVDLEDAEESGGRIPLEGELTHACPAGRDPRPTPSQTPDPSQTPHPSTTPEPSQTPDPGRTPRSRTPSPDPSGSATPTASKPGEPEPSTTPQPSTPRTHAQRIATPHPARRRSRRPASRPPRASSRPGSRPRSRRRPPWRPNRARSRWMRSWSRRRSSEQAAALATSGTSRESMP